MASVRSRSSAQEAKEMLELKKKAVQYYTENGVPEKMEEILNSTYYDNPVDVYGHLANYFDGFAKTPTITKIFGREALDSRGQTTIQTEIYCMVKNHEKLISTTLASNECYPQDSMKQEEKDSVETERQKSVTQAVEFINTTFSDALKDADPTKQRDVDALLISTLEQLVSEAEEKTAREKEESGEEPAPEVPAISPKPTDSKTKPKSAKGKNKGPAVVVIPDEPREKFLCGCVAVSALSQAVADAAAHLQGEPLYKHLASLRQQQPDEGLCLPLPMVTIMMSGKLAPGKLNCVKEFMVVPKHDMPVKESIKHISNIYNHCAKVLSAKTGIVGKAVNDTGALWCTFDRPEQGLDLLQEAITQLSLTPGEHFNIALNCAGQECFDYEKGKYEVVTGLQKQAEDLAEYWGDILTRYPSVIALIDPMRKQEKEGWMKLCERVSEACYVLGDMVHHRPGLLKDEETDPDFRTSGVVFRLENINTISDITEAGSKMEEAGSQIVMSTGAGESTDSFIVDMAVGLGVRFLKLGAPCRGERVIKLNRLLQIEAALESYGSLKTLDPHTFPVIKPPTPPPEEGESQGEGATEGEGAQENKS